MESNQPIPTVPQPVPEAATFINPEHSAKASSNKIFMIIIIVVLLLLAVGGAAYFWMSSKKSTEPVAVSQPTIIETADLNSELEATQPTDLEAEFSEIDKDLQNL